MAVFREQSFPYLGNRLTMVPSLALLRRIKARGINNVILSQSCVSGGVDIEDLCVVHSAFCAEAGVEVSEEESYSYLTGGNIAEVQEFQMAYIQAVLPGVDFGKKPAPQASTPTKRPAKKPKKT